MHYLPYTLASALIIALCMWAISLAAAYLNDKYFHRVDGSNEMFSIVVSGALYLISISCVLLSLYLPEQETFLQEFVVFFGNFFAFCATLLSTYLTIDAIKKQRVANKALKAQSDRLAEGAD